jgi:NAD(P)-dependent dehydrogenase (short-subunit alcohol dehydrogenase family)
MLNLSSNSQFVTADVRSWDDQVALFEAAMKNSPSHSVDIAIANAGIGSDNDKLCEIGGESQPSN